MQTPFYFVTDFSGDMRREDLLNDTSLTSRGAAGVKTENGYGLVSLMMSSILVTSFGQMDMDGNERRRIRLGARFGSIGSAAHRMNFELTCERIDSSSRDTDHRIDLLGRMSF